MAEKDKYIIKVEGKLVEVTPEVYYAYSAWSGRNAVKRKRNREMRFYPTMHWIMVKQWELKLCRI